MPIKFKFDGQSMKFESSKTRDDDSDVFQRTVRNEQEIVQPTELGETLKEVNKDEVEADSRMSSIDLKARLSQKESPAILAYDTMVALKFLPKDALFLTRQRKRLSVSEDGQGRKETVEIVRGVKDAESKTGMMNAMGGLFGGQKKE